MLCSASDLCAEYLSLNIKRLVTMSRKQEGSGQLQHTCLSSSLTLGKCALLQQLGYHHPIRFGMGILGSRSSGASAFATLPTASSACIFAFSAVSSATCRQQQSIQRLAGGKSKASEMVNFHASSRNLQPDCGKPEATRCPMLQQKPALVKLRPGAHVSQYRPSWSPPSGLSPATLAASSAFCLAVCSQQQHHGT